jgi:hypothetical protein
VSFLKVFNQPLPFILQDIITNCWGSAGPGNIQFCLFNAVHAPLPMDTAATYNAIECAFPGYARQIVASAAWGAPFLSLDTALSLGPPVQFVRGIGVQAPSNVYGYYVLQEGGNIIWAQAFDTPVPIVNPGDTVLFAPQFSFLSQH